MAFSNAFVKFSKGFIFGASKEVTYREFLESLTETERVEFDEFKAQYDGVADEDLETVWDSSINKWVQKYVDLASTEAKVEVSDSEIKVIETKKVETLETLETPETPETPKAETKAETKAPKAKKAPKAPKAKKAKKGWSANVDRFISRVGITDARIIEALRGQDVRECYAGKEHCYVKIACRSKLIAMSVEESNHDLFRLAAVKANKSAFDGLVKNNFFGIADLRIMQDATAFVNAISK